MGEAKNKLTVKVAFWPHTLDSNIASYRLRCLNVVEGLISRGLDIKIFSYRDIPEILILSKRYDKKTLKHALKLKNKFGTKVFLDICDNHFFYQKNFKPASDRANSLRSAIKSVDGVVVCSDYLKKVVLNEVPSVKTIVVIDDVLDLPYHPTFIDKLKSPIEFLSYLRIKKLLLKETPLYPRLIWFGNHSGGYAEGGMDSLSNIYPFLFEAYKRNPFTLTIVSNSKKHYDKLTSGWVIPTLYAPWSKLFFTSILELHHIAVLPIEKNPFTLAKTSNRLCSALMHGLNVVTDAIPSYREFSKDVSFGNWLSSLMFLIGNTGRRGSRTDFSSRNYLVVSDWHEFLERHF